MCCDNETPMGCYAVLVMPSWGCYFPTCKSPRGILKLEIHSRRSDTHPSKRPRLWFLRGKELV